MVPVATQNPEVPRLRASRARLLIVFSLVYFTCARLGLSLRDGDAPIAPLWPAGGIALALALIDSRARYLLAASSVFAAHLIARLSAGDPWLLSAALALASCMEPVVGAALLMHACRGRPSTARLRDVALFVALALAGNTLAGMLAAAIASSAVGVGFGSMLATWVVAHAAGMLVLTPLILDWTENGRTFLTRLRGMRGLEFIALIVLAAVIATWVFSTQAGKPLHGLRLTYWVFPTLLWAALRSGPTGTTATVALVSVIAVVCTANGFGPFVRPGMNTQDSLFQLQTFLCVLGVSCLAGAAVSAERDRAMQAAQSSEHRYRELFEALPDGVMVHDGERILHVNPALARVMGAGAPEELVGRDPLTLVLPENREETRQRIQHQLRDRTGVPLGERRLLRLDGRTVDVEMIVAPPVFVDGHPVLQFAIRDVSERKRAEADRQASEAMLREARQLAGVGTYSWRDESGQTPVWSEEMFDILEWPRPTPPTMEQFMPLVHPDDIEQMQAALRARDLGLGQGPRSAVRFEFRRLLHDGGVRYLAGVSAVERDDEGRPIRRFGAIHDITEQKRTEQALRASEALRREAQRSARMGSWTWSGALDEPPVWSEEMFELYPVPRGTAPSVEQLITLIHPDDRERFMTTLRRALETREARVEFDYRVPWPDGRVLTIVAMGAVERDAQGKVIRILGTAQDITERKAMEDALRERSTLLTEAQRVARIGSWVWSGNPAERPIYSDAFYELFPVPRGERPSVDEVLSWVHPDDQQRVRAQVRQRRELHELGPAEIEYRVPWPDGRTLNIVSTSVIERDHEGRLLRVVGTHQDITARKQMENALRESEARLNEAQRIGRTGSFEQRGNELSWSAQMYELLAVPHDVKPSTELFRSRIHPDDLARVDSEIASVATEDRGLQSEYRVRLPNGEILHLSVVAQAERDAAGNLIRVFGVNRDVTAQRRAEEALQQTRALLAEAQRLARIGSWVWTGFPHSPPIWSDELFDVYGRAPGPVPPLAERLTWIHPEDRPRTVESMKRLTESAAGTRVELETRILLPNGEVRYVASTAAVVSRTEAGPAVMVGMVQDITDRKRFEGRIVRMNEELERRVEERTAQLNTKTKELETFSYSVSHDLKAPLRGIDGYSRLLLADYQDKLDEEGRGFLQNIRQGTRQMKQLIDDLLAYSRMERRTVARSRVELGSFIERLLEEHLVDMGHVELIRDVPNLVVAADPDGLATAVRNLLDNAVKFSSKQSSPHIEIHATSTNGTCTLSVKDNGIGFDMAYADKVFEIFQRLQRSEDYAGTGIGLALVRKAMERMGGRVWAVSRPQQGATFFLELPRWKED